MKKFLVIIPIILTLFLASCSTPEAPKSYSYKFGYVSEREDGLLESFIYDVEAKDDAYLESSLKPLFHLVGTGTYTLNVYRDADDPKLFKLETSFSFKGRYKFADNTYSEEFEDSFTGISYMRVDASSFEPVSMRKEYLATILSQDGIRRASYQDGIRRASYVVDVQYTKADGGFSVKSTVTDRQIEGLDAIKVSDSKNADVTMELGGRVIDSQEQIFFALRLQKIGEGFTDSITAYNPMYVLTQSISVHTESEKTVKKFDGKDYPCFQLSASIMAQGLSASTTFFFTEAYPVKYLSGDGTEITQNASLLLEIKHCDLLYTLKEYKNYAQKAPQ